MVILLPCLHHLTVQIQHREEASPLLSNFLYFSLGEFGTTYDWINLYHQLEWKLPEGAWMVTTLSHHPPSVSMCIERHMSKAE